MTPNKSPRGRRGGRNDSNTRDDFRWGFVGDDDSTRDDSSTPSARTSERTLPAAPPRRTANEPNRLDESEISELIVTPTGIAGMSKRKQRAAERRSKTVTARPTPPPQQTPPREAKSQRTTEPPKSSRAMWGDEDESLALPSYGRGLVGPAPSRKIDAVVLSDSEIISTMTPDTTSPPPANGDPKTVACGATRSRPPRERRPVAKPTTAPVPVAVAKPAKPEKRERRETLPPKPAEVVTAAAASLPPRSRREQVAVTNAVAKTVAPAKSDRVKPARRLPPGAIPDGILNAKMVWNSQKREYVAIAAETPIAAPPQPKRERPPKFPVAMPPAVGAGFNPPVVESPAREPKREPQRAAKPEPRRETKPPIATVPPVVESPVREPNPESRLSPPATSHSSHTPRRKPVKRKSDTSAADAEAEPTGFAALGLSPEMLAALKVVRYLEPTPIQSGVLTSVLAGRDVMGQARTGTGKTAAFVIPLLEMMSQQRRGAAPRTLILVPTRELAVQVRDEAVRLCYGRDILATACYGGKPLAKQILRLREGADIVVGTPGRVLDLMARRALVVSEIQWVVLDEADRMLDIGFRPAIEKILRQVPKERQTLLFSATLPAPVVKLAERYMRDPEVLDFSEKDVSVETIEQFYVTIDPERKFDALVKLLGQEKPNQAIVFCRTKRGADKVARHLERRVASVAVIHGDLAQTVRDRVMSQFRSGEIKVLVATDVVGRGIDVSGISHIINYDIPAFCDDYVHRVGRTGRMGREGIAFTFVTTQEGQELTRIEMRINKLLKRANLEGFESFTKPADTSASDGDGETEAKPVYGKTVRKIRRAL